MSDWLHGMQVPALYIKDLRSLTKLIREHSTVAAGERFPVLPFLEFSLSGAIDHFDFEVVESLPSNMEACAYPDGCTKNPDGPFIEIKQSVYEAAYAEDGRARFTILHECGHVLLHRKVSVHHRGPSGAELKPYENSEWQANVFAAELLMPPESFHESNSLEEYCMKMGVSRKAATIQGKKLVRRKEIENCEWLKRIKEDI